ncbi:MULTISPECIES: S8 family serine peptidase [unclassified Carboxylicivirga]|uniref:S8 family serine peptidase n=1 Tax=Carboxylicivirga TaxID=1628153 RepID=UPI003D337EB5
MQALLEAFAKRYELSRVIPNNRGGVAVLQWIRNKRPVYLSTHNTMAAFTIAADAVWPTGNTGFQLDGTGIEIGLWDGGGVLQAHQEFAVEQGIWQRDKPSFLLNHSTHIAGTLNAAGVVAESKGLAWKASILAYDFGNDEAEMALAASEGLCLSNHSYGAICGWSFNLQNETWYWHGLLSEDPDTDKRFGLYDITSQDIDFMAYHAPAYLMVKSAGNDRGQGPVNQPVRHFDWIDGWVEANDIHSIDGGTTGYGCLTPKAVAKNNLVIGSVKDLPQGYISAESVEIAAYSAFGPCNDGRIKPDLVANGEGLFSCVSDSLDAYSIYSGTSMAAASVSGALALLLQYQQQRQPGISLWSSSLKALLINTADECGSSPGPDYQYGWGLLNTERAASCMLNDMASGGACIKQNTLNEGAAHSYPLHINQGQESLKMTLCWTDPPGPVNTPGDQTQAALSNNLDLTLINEATGEIHYPWMLDPANPTNAATKGTNCIDNVEQIQLDNPPPGDYCIVVSATSYKEDDPQSYSLVIYGHDITDELYPATNLRYRQATNQARLYWTPPTISPHCYLIYCNNELIGSTGDTCFTAPNLNNGTLYRFQVRASYANDQLSLPSNTIDVMPREMLTTPYATNFEATPSDWEMKGSLDGWRWGTKDSTTSYYLNFDNTEGHFIWIDSGINTWHAHVSDVAASPPLNLAGHSNIVVTYRYIFVTGMYNVIDEMHLAYRQIGDEAWTKVAQPVASSKWYSATCSLPPEAALENVQIGFYYDDFYLQGMGAAIDDISISSTPPTGLPKNKFSSTVYLVNRQVHIETSNTAIQTLPWELINLSGRLIDQGQVQLIGGKARIQLTNRYHGICLLRLSFKSHSESHKLLIPHH